MKKYIFFFFIIVIGIITLFGCGDNGDEPNNEVDIPSEDEIINNDEINNNDEPNQEIDIDDEINNNDEEITKEELIKQKDIIFEWLTSIYDGYEIKEDFKLPIKHPDYDLEIEFYSFDKYLDRDGKYTPPILDYESEVLFLIMIDKEEYELFLPVTYVGYGDEFDVIYYELKATFPQILTSSINLYSSVSGHDATISWKSNTKEVIEDDGTIHRHMKENKTGELVAEIKIGEEVREFVFLVNVARISEIERIGYAKDWLDNNFSVEGVISKDLDLPLVLEEYDAYFIWKSSAPSILSNSGKFSAPFIDEDIVLTVNVRVGVRSETINYTLKAKAIELDDIWDKIEVFLDRINIKEIKNQKFYLYGSEEGYARVPSQNIGYLPFYDEAEMVIIQDFLPYGSGLKPDTKRYGTHYIVVHNTGMAAPSATAKGLNDYIHSTTRVASWHFSIDDHETYQHVPIDEVAWHAGDGSRRFGEVWEGGIGGGNQNGVAIETCVYEGIDFNTCMRRLAKLVASLLIKYDLGFDRVKQHYDFSGKDCPQVIRQSGRWDELMNMIRLEHFAQTNLKGVHFEWVSLSRDIMDDYGRIINHPGDATEINYKVIVTYNGETKEFYYSSLLLELKD